MASSGSATLGCAVLPPPAPPSVIAAIRYRMIWRSTGPPGTKCVMTKTASVIPMKVGITSRSRRMK